VSGRASGTKVGDVELMGDFDCRVDPLPMPGPPKSMQEAPPRVPILVSPRACYEFIRNAAHDQSALPRPGHQLGRIHLVEDAFHSSEWDAEKNGR
jgi:hypothetical protein